MIEKALFQGEIYTFLELIPALDQNEEMILCTNASGQRFVCTTGFWRDNPVYTEKKALVHGGSTAQEKIEFFLSVFKGRSDLYARRYHSIKTGKSGYTPVCRNEWDSELCNKKKHKCPECPNREFLPLTTETVRAHRYCIKQQQKRTSD